jgi:hypothetical protein
MSRTVIQHQQRARKRAGPSAWIARRLGALVVTVAGLAVATWLSLALIRNAPPQPTIASAPPAVQLSPPTPGPEVTEINAALDLPKPAPVRRRIQRQEVGVPLNASEERVSDGFEILNASELASISQARE